MGPETGRLSDFLLELYRNAHQLQPDELQRNTLSQLRGLVAFDFAAWGGGSAADRMVTDVLVVNQSPELFTEWSRVAAEDAYCGLALRRINSTVLFDDVPDFRRSCAYQEHWRRFDARNMVATIMAEPLSGYVSFVGLCRADPASRFTERERAVKQQLMPHIASALRLNQETWVLRSGAAVEGVALVNGAGLVLASRPPFAELAREEWGRVPAQVAVSLLQQGAITGSWRGQAIQLRIQPLAANYLLRARPLSPLEHMTWREQQVAERFAQGLTHKAVARDLGIAPSTVRNHLARIYERLGIGRKSELVKLLG